MTGLYMCINFRFSVNWWSQQPCVCCFQQLHLLGSVLRHEWKWMPLRLAKISKLYTVCIYDHRTHSHDNYNEFLLQVNETTISIWKATSFSLCVFDCPSCLSSFWKLYVFSRAAQFNLDFIRIIKWASAISTNQKLQKNKQTNKKNSIIMNSCCSGRMTALQTVL